MKKPPKWVDRICKSFGKTLDGHQRYRVIWGPDREEIRYGQKCKRYDDVDPRWILEVFVPHDVYGPWDEEALGPKPSGGEYYISQIIQVNGEYLSMEQYGEQLLRLLITVVEKGKALSEWEKQSWREAQAAKQEAVRKQRFSDIYDDATGPFGENAISGIPSKRRSDDVRVVDISTLSPELRNRLATRAGQIKQL